MADNDAAIQPADEQAVLSFLASYSPQVQSLALRLRALVLAAVPGSVEQIDPPARLIGYGFDRSYKGTICVILLSRSGVSLGLPRGAELPDPAGLLGGSGKRARHVKITALEQVELPALRDLIEGSAAQIRRSAGG